MGRLDRVINHGIVSWNTTRRALLGKDRCIQLARPRQVLMWFAKRRYGFSLVDTGRCLHRDHTTVLHGVVKVDQLLAEGDPLTTELWDAFDVGAPNMDTVRRLPFACNDMSVPIVKFEFNHTGWEVPLEDIPEGVEIPIQSVIDEDAMVRRRMAGR